MRRKLAIIALNVAFYSTLCLLMFWALELASKLNKLIMSDNPLAGLLCQLCLLCIPAWLIFLGASRRGDLEAKP